MTLFEQLAPGPYLGWLALEVVAQITAVILVAQFLARTVMKQSPAMRHLLWLCCLVCVFLSPAVAATLNHAEVSLAIVPWKQSTRPRPATVVAPAVDSYREKRHQSADLTPKFSTAAHEARTQSAAAPTAGPIQSSRHGDRQFAQE